VVSYALLQLHCNLNPHLPFHHIGIPMAFTLPVPQELYPTSYFVATIKPDLVQLLAHKLFGLAANPIAKSYG
jgi:hypothetical protein